MNKEINYIFCFKCGKENLANNEYCIYCGERIKQESIEMPKKLENYDQDQSDLIYQDFVEKSEIQPVSKKSNKNSFLIVLAFIFAFIILGSFGIVGLGIFSILLITYIRFGKANNVYGILLKIVGGFFSVSMISMLIMFGICFVNIL